MKYPYPRLDQEGYEFEVVEADQWQEQGFIRAPVPSDESRFSVQAGDFVKLIFNWRDPIVKNGQTFTAEHMWVIVTGDGYGWIEGELNNDPGYSKILECGATVRFHPKHIIAIEPPTNT